MKASVVFGISVAALTLSAVSFAEDKQGAKVQQKDKDTDLAVPSSEVSTTQTTAANYDSRRDAVESRAEDRREQRGDRWSVAPQVGAATNGYGFGLGARVGYTFKVPIYVGGNFMYHAGSGNESGTERAWYPSGEAGYDVGIGPVLVRPYVGLGYLMRDNAKDAGMVYPGVTVAYLIKDSPVFIGADGRVLLPLADGGRALGISGTAGVNF